MEARAAVRETLGHQLPKTGAPFLRYGVNRPLSASRLGFAPSGYDKLLCLQPSHRVIEGAHIEVHITFNLGSPQSPLDFIGVQVAPMKHAKYEDFGFHLVKSKYHN